MRNTVLVKGLPSDVTVPAMTGIAIGFGRPTRVVVEHSAGRRPARAMCWITYEGARNAAQAVEQLNGKMMGGRRIAARRVAD